MATVLPEIPVLDEETVQQHSKIQPLRVNDVKCFFPVEQQCAWCDTRAFNLRACTRCWAAKYCNRTCQRSHWPVHKRECKEDSCRSRYFKGGRVPEVAMNSPNGVSAALTDDEGGRFVLDLTDCPKHGHNNHAEFIPVSDFELQHLPEEVRSQEVLDYLLAESKMTVRVLVKWTSINRPDTDAFAQFRGTSNGRTASGTYTMDNPDNFRSRECPIENCPRAADLGTPHDIYEVALKIFSNKHVLFDEEELHKTVVDFFYTSADRTGVVREHALEMFYTKPSSDKTFFKVTIHDPLMLLRLDRFDIERGQKFRALSPEMVLRMSKFAFVFSHPHGMPMKISVGKVVKVIEENVTEETMKNAKKAGDLEREWFQTKQPEDYNRFMGCLGSQNLPIYSIWHNSPTCQGSSGGRVVFGGKAIKGHWGPFLGTHTGYDIDSNLNFFKVVKFTT